MNCQECQKVNCPIYDVFGKQLCYACYSKIYQEELAKAKEVKNGKTLNDKTPPLHH